MIGRLKVSHKCRHIPFRIEPYQLKGRGIIMTIPKDPVILLSFVNTHLRDYYNSLKDFCKSLDVNEIELIEKLSTIQYEYNAEQNQFI
jgi:hypothetical protein